jgi:hypothetical protein
MLTNVFEVTIWSILSFSITLLQRDRHGHDHMVVGFTTTYAVSSYHHVSICNKGFKGYGVYMTFNSISAISWRSVLLRRKPEDTEKTDEILIIFKGVCCHISIYTVTISCHLLYMNQVPVKPY